MFLFFKGYKVHGKSGGVQEQLPPFSRDQLLNRVWGYAFDGENRTVDVHIRTLRQKLGPCGDYIETVRGVGYKIGGDIS